VKEVAFTAATPTGKGKGGGVKKNTRRPKEIIPEKENGSKKKTQNKGSKGKI